KLRPVASSAEASQVAEPLILSDASSPLVRTLPITSFGFKIGPQQKQAEETMRGVVFTGERGLELMQFPDPTPEAHDVVVEMKASGMCGSDLHQYRRPKGQPQATGIPDGGTDAGHCRSEEHTSELQSR